MNRQNSSILGRGLALAALLAFAAQAYTQESTDPQGTETDDPLEALIGTEPQPTPSKSGESAPEETEPGAEPSERAQERSAAEQDEADQAGTDRPQPEPAPAPYAESVPVDVRAPAAEPGPTPPPAARGIEEVIVTAQKRAQSLQDVPIAINALGAEELERRGISGLSGLSAGEIPALRMEPFAGNPSVMEVAIRGLQNPNGTEITQENPVPLYIDDVYFGRQQALTLELGEIERIEVLRGPQGTLFGRNAEGGAVRVVTRAPSGELGLRANAEGGNHGFWKAAAHLDLPSFAGFAVKLEGLATDRDGWVRNPDATQEDLGRVKSEGGRLAVRWQGIDTLTADYAFDYTQLATTNGYNQMLSTTDSLQVWPEEPERQDRAFYPHFRPLDDQRFFGHRFALDWTATDWLTIRSISAWRDDESLTYNTAITAAAVPGAALQSEYAYLTSPTVIYDVVHGQFTQELQLVATHERVEWVAGAFYLDEDGSMLLDTYFGTAFPYGTEVQPHFRTPVPTGPAQTLDPPFLIPNTTTGALIENESIGFFGQITWQPPILDDRLKLTAGLRWGEDEKIATRPVGGIYDEVTYPLVPGNPATTPPPDETCPCAPRSITEQRWLPLAVIAYDWTEGTSSYLRYATGYRAAAFGLSSQTFRPVESDFVTTYELGLKTDLFDRRLRVNLAAFRQEWDDVQTSVQTVSSSVLEFFNGPTITVDGVEIDTSWLALDDLTINLSGTWYRGEQPTVENPFPPPGTSGSAPVFSQLVQLPEYTGTLSMFYDIARLGRFGTLRGTLDMTATSFYYSVPQVSVPASGRALLNGRLALAEIALGASELSLSLWGRNLLDRDYRTFVYAAPGVGPPTQGAESSTTVAAAFGEPRMFGLSLGYRF
jgi:iron complex outermembrane recepter protein